MTQAPTEKWFTAVLVFESHIVGVYDDDKSVDAQYRLVRAADAESAYQRALAIGRREQHSYTNADGNTCEWRFVGLEDLQEVEDSDLRHGTEVYGFIEKGAAADRVVEKDQLTEFLGGDNEREGR